MLAGRAVTAGCSTRACGEGPGPPFAPERVTPVCARWDKRPHCDPFGFEGVNIPRAANHFTTFSQVIRSLDGLEELDRPQVYRP